MNNFNLTYHSNQFQILIDFGLWSSIEGVNCKKKEHPMDALFFIDILYYSDTYAVPKFGMLMVWVKLFLIAYWLLGFKGINLVSG